MARRSQTPSSAPAEGADDLSRRLARLKRVQLEALVRSLLADHPDWQPAIDQQLGALEAAPDLDQPPEPSRTRKQAPETAKLRRELRSLWRGLGPYDTYTYVDIARDFAARAYPFLERNDGRGALAVAILTADLSENERHTCAEQLRRWKSEVDDYGVDTAFGVALEALSATPSGAPGGSTDLALAQLNVLERQERLEQALDMAERADVPDRYVSLLIRLGRLPQAQQYAMERLSQAHDVAAIACLLHEHGSTQQALELGEHGLSLAGETRTLARWVRDTAAEADQEEMAVRAGLRVLAELPALDDYRALASVAGDNWQELREPVLDQLRERARISPVAVGEILLFEGLVDEAVALADQVPTAYSFVEQVADAAMTSHSEWVDRMARRQAERIMDGGDARYYHYAIAWLKRARAATLTMRRESEWRQYVTGLMARHSRKRALLPGLTALRVGA